MRDIKDNKVIRKSARKVERTGMLMMVFKSNMKTKLKVSCSLHLYIIIWWAWIIWNTILVLIHGLQGVLIKVGTLLDDIFMKYDLVVILEHNLYNYQLCKLDNLHPNVISCGIFVKWLKDRLIFYTIHDNTNDGPFWGGPF